MSAIREDPVVGRCSKCHENTQFLEDPYELEWMSVCCWRPMDDPSADADRRPDD